jgi:hypothetical protein
MIAARRFSRVLLFALPGIAACAFALLAAPAAAHEHVTVDPYEFVIGWKAEPAVVGSLNGLDMHIIFHGPGNATAPVVGVQADLTATLSSNGQSAVRAVAPEEGDPGGYAFDVIPSREGAYTVRIAGTVNGTLVNISVALDAPSPASDLEFPASDPTNEKLALQLSETQASLASANANATALGARVAAAQAAADAAALSSPSSAMTLALVGVALGAAGLVVATLAWRANRQKK